ncbi:unnamed protein product, partial [Ectocarpus sp. 6 AP-2014]
IVEAEKLPSAVRTKMKHSDPWQATAMDEEAECLDWAAKDGQKPAGNFDADYAALCRLFQVPAHPCLASRVPRDTSNQDASAAAASKTTSSTIQLRNFAVDLTTVRLMMEALKRSSDVDTVDFHNAGLTGASIDVLVEGLPHTTVRCFALDYNTPPVVLSSSSPPTRPPPSGPTEPALEEAPATEGFSSLTRNFAGLVSEGSKLKALSLRGNALGDAEAIALAEAIEENTALCSLNLFDNKITDVGASAFAATLRINTVLRGLSLARNSLTPASAEAFGLLLAGGYEVLPPEQEKRAAADVKIATQNKLAADAMKKKKDAKVETRLPLSAVTVRTGEDGRSRAVAGGSRSLAALNLADNRDLGEGGALAGLLSRIVNARKEEAEEAGVGAGFGAGGGSVVLQELHLTRCQGYAEEAGGEDDTAIAAMSFALRPTKVVV